MSKACMDFLLSLLMLYLIKECFVDISETYALFADVCMVSCASPPFEVDLLLLWISEVR